jgi:hypothetical protein
MQTLSPNRRCPDFVLIRYIMCDDLIVLEGEKSPGGVMFLVFSNVQDLGFRVLFQTLHPPLTR